MFQNIVFERESEIVAITINVLTTRVYIIGVYRLPSKEIDLFFKTFLECPEQIKLNEKTTFLGDFNTDFMKTDSKITNQFVNLIKTFGLKSSILTNKRIYKRF